VLAARNSLRDRMKAAIYYDSFLLRGASLRNTEWVIGLVVHTGHQTRIMMNSTGSKAKSSKIEKLINVMIAYIFLLQICLCMIAAIYGTIWENVYESKAFYLDLASQGFHVSVQVLTKFGTWILIFTNIVPISLIVTLEMVKYLQAFFMGWDYMMYDENLDEPAKVQSSNLNEELGQISHIFSDKTGTLTCNIMEFKKFSVGLKSYGTLDPPKEKRRSYLGEEGISNVNFVDRQFEKDYLEEDSQQRADILRMLLCLALCHTIVVQYREDAEEYIAQSPDELALVNAARFLGVKFVGRDEDSVITLQVARPYLQKARKFRLLNVIEFDSARKRMSVVVQDSASEKIFLFCKGADSIIMPLLSTSHHNFSVKNKTEEFLENYAQDGLRTLLLTERELEIGWYK